MLHSSTYRAYRDRHKHPFRNDENESVVKLHERHACMKPFLWSCLLSRADLPWLDVSFNKLIIQLIRTLASENVDELSVQLWIRGCAGENRVCRWRFNGLILVHWIARVSVDDVVNVWKMS